MEHNEEDKGTKWECMIETCGHIWYESPFVTCGDCPKCGDEYVEHH